MGMQDKEDDHFIGAIRGRDIYRNLGGEAGGGLITINEVLVHQQETRNCSAMGGSSYYNSHDHTHTFGQAEPHPIITEQEKQRIFQRLEDLNNANSKTLIQELQSECNEWLKGVK